MAGKYIQLSTATSGSVSIDQPSCDMVLAHHAASTAATLTINFPGSPIDSQVIYVTSSLGVTSLTVTTTEGTLSLPPASIAAGGSFAYIYSKALDRWFRIA